MSSEIFTNYWIGEEPTGPGQSPILSELPAFVDVVPLAFVTLTDKHQLDFNFLCKQNSAATIQGWIKEVRALGTKVLLSIISGEFGKINDPNAFAKQVQESVHEWGVDGVDIDFEPFESDPNVVKVVDELRNVLGDGALLTAPIYDNWDMDLLHPFARPFDYLTTMDYTPYRGFEDTIAKVKSYAEAIGTSAQPNYDKIAIGISCMEPNAGNFTPLNDVIKLSRWEPEKGKKKGAMLYTFSYDIETRPGAGTGHPNGTWTRTIHENLP